MIQQARCYKKKRASHFGNSQHWDFHCVNLFSENLPFDYLLNFYSDPMVQKCKFLKVYLGDRQ